MVGRILLLHLGIFFGLINSINPEFFLYLRISICLYLCTTILKFLGYDILGHTFFPSELHRHTFFHWHLTFLWTTQIDWFSPCQVNCFICSWCLSNAFFILEIQYHNKDMSSYRFFSTHFSQNRFTLSRFNSSLVQENCFCVIFENIICWIYWEF